MICVLRYSNMKNIELAALVIAAGMSSGIRSSHDHCSKYESPLPEISEERRQRILQEAEDRRERRRQKLAKRTQK
jgi:hypothetical protein